MGGRAHLVRPRPAPRRDRRVDGARRTPDQGARNGIHPAALVALRQAVPGGPRSPGDARRLARGRTAVGGKRLPARAPHRAGAGPALRRAAGGDVLRAVWDQAAGRTGLHFVLRQGRGLPLRLLLAGRQGAGFLLPTGARDLSGLLPARGETGVSQRLPVGGGTIGMDRDVGQPLVGCRGPEDETAGDMPLPYATNPRNKERAVADPGALQSVIAHWRWGSKEGRGG